MTHSTVVTAEITGQAASNNPAVISEIAIAEVESPCQQHTSPGSAMLQPEPEPELSLASGPGLSTSSLMSNFDVTFVEPTGTPLGLGMLELHDPEKGRDLLVLETVSDAAAARHPGLLRPGLVVQAINGLPTRGAFSSDVRAGLAKRPVTISFALEGEVALENASSASTVDTVDAQLLSDILSKKAEAEASLQSRQSGGGRLLRKLAGAAKDRLKQLDERLDGTDDGRLEPSVLFRLPAGVNAGDRGRHGGSR